VIVPLLLDEVCAMEEKKKSVTLKIGWILLVALGGLIILGGVESLYVAYWGFGDAPAGVQLSDLAKVNPDLPAALRGRRATAASLAVTCGLALCWLAAAPYSRAEKWAWYAVLAAFGIGSILSLLRLPVLGTRAGTALPVFALVVMLAALAVSYRDFRK
jgi:hypothetical protein